MCVRERERERGAKRTGRAAGALVYTARHTARGQGVAVVARARRTAVAAARPRHSRPRRATRGHVVAACGHARGPRGPARCEGVGCGGVAGRT